MTRPLSALALLLGLPALASAQKIAVEAGKYDRSDVVVSARLPLGGSRLPGA